RRARFFVVCTVQIAITGCMQRTVTKNGAFSAQQTVREKEQLPLSDYIRKVYSSSMQNTVEAEEVRRRGLDSRPDLAQLDVRVAGDAKDLQSRNKLAEGYLGEGLLWSAYHLYQESVSLSESNFEAEVGLAQIWDKWGDYAVARQHAAAALASNLAP